VRVPRSFNSSVGILSVGTQTTQRPTQKTWGGFNSSVGILSVGTMLPVRSLNEIARFQFLSRNSVRWDTDYAATYAKDVGGFQFLSRNSVRWDDASGALPE